MQRRSGPGVMRNPPGLVYCYQQQCIQEAHGLKGSLVSDGSFIKAEMKVMAGNWLQVEDDPDIIDSELDEAIELLRNLFFCNYLIYDKDKPEDIMPINQKFLVL